MDLEFTEPTDSAFPDLPAEGLPDPTPSTAIAAKPNQLLEKPATTKPQVIDPTLPKYLQIKLTPIAISKLPVSQQAIAKHVMALRKDRNNRKSQLFLSQWLKRLKPGSERDTLNKLIHGQ